MLHLASQDISWFQNRWTSFIAICALGIWKGIGWSMLIFLAALTAGPRELHEAAAIDGAGAFGPVPPRARCRSIRSAISVVVILLVIGGFNVFISVLLITGGENDTQVPLTYMYDQAFKFLDFGYGSAISVLADRTRARHLRPAVLVDPRIDAGLSMVTSRRCRIIGYAVRYLLLAIAAFLLDLPVPLHDLDVVQAAVA